MSCVNSGRRRFATGQTPLHLPNPAMSFLPRAVTTVRQSSTAPKVFALQRNGRTRHYLPKTTKMAMATPRMLNGARVNLMPRCVYQGSMKITAIEKRKLSSKRDDILDNTEPCQTKIRRSQCCCGRTIMVIFRREKVALLNVITITFSRRYLQITYKLTTLTGAACGIC